MASQLDLSGSYVITPLAGTAANGEATTSVPFEELLIADRTQSSELRLTSDAAVAVDFGGLADAAFVGIHAAGGRVVATLTSPDGTAQTIPVDPCALLLSASAPYTAITLTREPGVAVDVRIILAEKA